MKFYPILFNAKMVQANISGIKQETRRTVKGFPLQLLEVDGFTPEYVAMMINDFCPYGKIGDVLWVRETFAHTKQLNLNVEDKNYGYVYKADDQPWKDFEGWKWKPNIFMPKEACRLFLEIINIKIERLQDITEDAATLEGATHGRCIGLGVIGGSVREGFFNLWASINGYDSLKSNPWVWVITYKKIEKPENFV